MSAGNVGDLVQLSREYRPALMAFFLRRVGNHAEAEDLTQDVFARLATRQGQAVDSGHAYLFQVAANLLKDRQRRYKTRLSYRSSIGEIESENVDQLDPFRFAAGRSSIAAMCGALAELSETTQNIFILYRLEGIKKDVIADTFGISVSSVEKHITRSMAFLTARFGDEI